MFSVGNYELPGIENLYWLAPRDYLGNKLEIYGSSFVFNVQWVVMRGDTSGEPTIGPDMIVVGSNGLQLGIVIIISTTLRLQKGHCCFL